MNCIRFSRVGGAALIMAVIVLVCSISSAEDVERKTLELKLGGSDMIKTAQPFKRVSIADSEVADVVVLSPREIYVFGKMVGYTSVMLWEEGKSRTLLDVVVSLDLTALKQKLHELYPNQRIEVYASETGVVLSGTVSGPEVVEQVLRLTATYLPKEADDKGGKGGTGRSGGAITNLLKVGGLQQVMLEVKFAEVTRNSTRDWQAALGLAKLGNDFTGAAGVGNVLTPVEDAFVNLNFPNAPNQSGFFEGAIDGLIQNPRSLLLNFADNAANIFVNIDNFTAALQFLETEGLARTLAEPRLVAQSGQKASFLAGGEFPIPVPQDFGQITIEYKDFGVALVFTPVVLSDGRISLHVAPSVSEITSTSSIPAGITGAEFQVPSLATRRLDTTVQLHDGQTLALAGLLQDNLRERARKIPGLGDLPILGALFRSTGYIQDKTDLLVAVTPHIVKPVREGELEFPGEYLKKPNWYEFYLEGRLEGRRSAEDTSELSQHGFAVSSLPTKTRGGLEGPFGNQPLSAQ
ncbi:pilus assembly protein CpaC [Desulfuromonas versatilis]|uniref:Pilus assembly protein CpaC n=1 Tax=Desulfuromonas versatilis TaxID=2802975 RepID=A0ABN6DTK4_9BACT|nr:type II and III secretion system protein family protein [Desulfuromonas versatilis]BCR03452.1 pilus assembly protein CpaC [Desulfuromonas versatilis]